jgi:hypothetical protein
MKYASNTKQLSPKRAQVFDGDDKGVAAKHRDGLSTYFVFVAV